MDYNHPVSPVLSNYPGVGGGAGYDQESFRQPGWPTGSPVSSASADHVVESASELRQAVEATTGGEVVWIPGDAHLDVSGLEGLEPAGDVTVASDRGVGGSEGALLESTKYRHPLFKVREPGVRFTGLRFLYPTTQYEEYMGAKIATGIAVDAADVEVDNCVFRGFGHAGIEVGRDGYVEGTHVHHNHFVDNLLGGLGYGLVVFHGHPLVQANYFDNNRHGIAADGADDCAYTFYYNIVGSNGVGHPIDMHEGYGGNGGRSFHVVQNVVLLTVNNQGEVESGVYIRGDPIEESVIAHNQFAHGPKPTGTGELGDAYQLAVRSLDGSNIVPAHNHYGLDEPTPTPEH